jgi:two-component system sensor histidine kinase KdpD
VERISGLAAAVNRRRQLYGLALGVLVLPALTAVLTAVRGDLSLADDLLLYLLAVVAVSVVGGFWPAVAAATAASLLLNWYFTKPFHTFTISEPDNFLALMLFVVVAIAVSSVVHLAARRGQQAAQAEALAAGNRMRTALLAAVSHDLRTPLASIKAGITSLRQDEVSWSAADEAELLATIEEETDRLGSLIGNLLDMSRLQTGALQPFVTPAAIDEVALLALRSVPGGHTVRVDLPEGLPLVRTDPGLLERALANLLSNAVRYSTGERPAEISAEAVGDGVVVSVIDHGPGVRPADRERIFEPFQRLGDQDSTSGVGLGLAVARGFVEAVGGRIDTAATAGGGLTMVVRLPIATTHREPERVPT